MSPFEDKVAWILTDFKAGKKNFAETILEIESEIVRALGMNYYHFDQLREEHEYIESLESQIKAQAEAKTNGSL